MMAFLFSFFSFLVLKTYCLSIKCDFIQVILCNFPLSSLSQTFLLFCLTFSCQWKKNPNSFSRREKAVKNNIFF